MRNRKMEKLWDKLTNLIEDEIELATGYKKKKHFSKNCKMNQIMECVQAMLDLKYETKLPPKTKQKSRS